MSTSIDFQKLVIERGPLWTVQLHEDQTYLGRLVIALNRPAEIDWLELSDADHTEYFKTARRCKQVLTDLFAPDMFNHASLRNEWHQQHVHMVPRYAAPREFAGHMFRDQRWGKNWAPYDKTRLPEADLLQIHAAIKVKLSITS